MPSWIGCATELIRNRCNLDVHGEDVKSQEEGQTY